MNMPKFEPVNIYNYLKHLGTSSTGHNNLSLLKELIDNSFDAKAKNIVIDKIINESIKNLIELIRLKYTILNKN